MTMQASGAITFAEIQTEHSGSNPIGLNEYYRGGSLTAFNPQNSNVPESGTIAADDFYSTRGFGATNGFIFTAGTTGGKVPSVGYWATNSLGNITQSSATQLSTKLTLIGWYVFASDYVYLKANSPSAATQNFMNGKKMNAKTSSFSGSVNHYVDFLTGNSNSGTVSINAGPYNGESQYNYQASLWNASPNRSGTVSSGTTYYAEIVNR